MQIASAAIPNKLLHANVTLIVPIFSGGGTRLSAHIGIIKALHDMNIGFDTLVGVSGGSIIASLYAKGYTVEQMRELALVAYFGESDRSFRFYPITFSSSFSSLPVLP